LHYACRLGHLTCAKVLIEEGNVRVHDVNFNKWNILHDIARFGHANVLDWLLSLPSPYADIINHTLLLQQTKFGSTPLHLALRHHHTECAQLLYSKQLSSVVKFNSRKQTFVHVAIEENLIAFCERLFMSNIDKEQILMGLIQAKDEHGSQLLHYCCVKPNDRMFLFLRLACAWLHKTTDTKTVVKLLLMKDRAGNNTLHYAMGADSRKCALFIFHYFLIAFHRIRKEMSSSIIPTTATAESTQKTQNPMNIQVCCFDHLITRRIEQCHESITNFHGFKI
jgi:ankyrin repeat protein